LLEEEDLDEEEEEPDLDEEEEEPDLDEEEEEPDLDEEPDFFFRWLRCLRVRVFLGPVVDSSSASSSSEVV
jgi:hypothetical protein